MRVVAILAVYNEARFIDSCLTHLGEQGVEAFVLDNDSSDDTVAIARRHLGRGLIGIERLPRNGVFSSDRIMARKAALAHELESDWFIHVDADEIRLPPPGEQSLATALEKADASGYNAVDFFEFTFVPTQEEPEHDHDGWAQTMRSYYPFRPAPSHRLNAWRKQPEPVDLIRSGGHRVDFPGLAPSPELFRMRHYLFLSHAHAVEKYVQKEYDPEEIARGQHRVRSALRAEDIRLPGEGELRPYTGDDQLDDSDPLTRHPCFVRR